MAPENWCLEDEDFFFGDAIFSVAKCYFQGEEIGELVAITQPEAGSKISPAWIWSTYNPETDAGY